MSNLRTLNSDYKGYITVYDVDPLYAQIYNDKSSNVFNLLLNEYLVVIGTNGTVVDVLKWQDGKHKPVYKKPVESTTIGKIRPKNVEQQCAIDMLMDDSVTVKLMTGTFGSGKTFLTCAAAFQMLQLDKYDRIVWVRNNIEVKNSNPIGHLKGDFYDKMSVWAMPLADHIGGKEMLDMYIQRGKVLIEHLGFLRGRDIKNALIFCTEAEHLTTDHVKLLLGRVAEGSCLVLEGDWRQVDAKAFAEDNGLLSAVDKLKGNRLAAYIDLHESVRSETAKLADLLD